MKWGRKNSQQYFWLLPQVFPTSWLAKIKHIGGKSKNQPTKTKKDTKFSSCRFYEGDIDDDDDEGYWRLSFGGESFEGGKTYTSALYDSEEDDYNDKLDDYSISNDRNCINKGKEDNKSFTNMVSDIKKMRVLGEKEEIVNQTPRRRIRESRKVFRGKSKRTYGRNLKNVSSDYGREMNEEIMQTVKKEYCSSVASCSRKSHYVSSSNCTQGRTISGGDQEFLASDSKRTGRSLEEFDDLERNAAKESKVKEIMSKNKKQRRLIDQNGEEHRRLKQRSRIRVTSPRTPKKIETCKIRALEDMKKAKMKNKKKGGCVKKEAKPDLKSYAMVKCSYDPQKDFRDSMSEMIIEKQIEQPEELEELLVCYLSLNSEEYHDIIIEVFKQVWYDLNHSSIK